MTLSWLNLPILWLGKLRPREQEGCALLPAGVYGLLGLLITRTLRNYSEVQSSLIILIKRLQKAPKGPLEAISVYLAGAVEGSSDPLTG